MFSLSRLIMTYGNNRELNPFYNRLSGQKRHHAYPLGERPAGGETVYEFALVEL